MNHFSESIYAVYVDGELSAEREREVEGHLISCRQCRELIVALRDEATLLGDILLDRPIVATRRAPAAPPARGLAVGVLPAIGVVAGLSAVLGAILDLRLPSSIDWLNPLSAIGATEMTFNLIFMLRDRAPGLLELALAVAATASVSAVLSFIVSSLARRRVGATALALCLLSLPFAATESSAFERRSEEEVRIAAGETIRNTLVATGDSVLVEGVIEGDLLAFAERFELRGEVRGNLFAVAEELELAGVVRGSAHLAGHRIDLPGQVDGNVYAAGERFVLGKTAVLGGDLSSLSDGLVVDGRIGRNLMALADWIEIRGDIAGNADTRSDSIKVFEQATIAGDFDVRVAEDGRAEIAPDASIGGETREQLWQQDMHAHAGRWLDGSFYMRVGILLTAMFLIGLTLNAVLPGIFDVVLESGGDFARVLGFGFVALVGIPIALLLCALTVIGIPIAVIGLWVYLTTLFIAGIPVASLVGESIMGHREDGDAGSFGLMLLVGLLVVGVASLLPFVGGLFRVIILLTGLGLITERALELWRARRRSVGFA